MTIQPKIRVTTTPTELKDWYVRRGVKLGEAITRDVVKKAASGKSGKTGCSTASAYHRWTSIIRLWDSRKTNC